jgi:hypothetical protein
VVGDGEGEDLGSKAFVGEAGPALQLVIRTQAEVGAYLIVRSDGSGIKGVREVGLTEWIIEVAATDHGFEVRDEGAIGPEVSTSDLIGTLVRLVAVGAGDLVELGFEAEVGVTVEVDVGGDALEGLLSVVWFGGGVAEAELEVAGPRGG